MKHLYFILCFVLVTQLSHAQSKAAAKKESAPALGPNFSGKVVETMNAASYTYVLVDTGKGKVWAAAVQFQAKKGDTIAVKGAMPMENYHSKTLNRDFEVVYFASAVDVNGKSPDGEAAALPPGHPPVDAPKSNLPKGHPPITGGDTVKNTGPVQKAAGGKTVAEIHAEKANLKGKPITVRGRVVKYNGGILGKNWLHIQDGTGNDATGSLVITTDSEVKLGDTILVNGKVSTDRDFGSGYKYDVMVENAKVTVE